MLLQLRQPLFYSCLFYQVVFKRRGKEFNSRQRIEPYNLKVTVPLGLYLLLIDQYSSYPIQQICFLRLIKKFHSIFFCLHHPLEYSKRE